MLGMCRQYVKDLQKEEDLMITAFMKVLQTLNVLNTKEEVLKGR